MRVINRQYLQDIVATICVVADDVTVYDVLRKHVADSRKVSLHHINANEKLLASVCAILPDCIVIDTPLCDIDAVGAYGNLLAHNINVPAIFILHRGDVRAAVQAIRAGANDVIEKPFSEIRLLRSVNRSLRLH